MPELTSHDVVSILDYFEDLEDPRSSINRKHLLGDLIVISTHGLSGLKRFLMGSVTEMVVRSAPCAVLTVKPFGKSLMKQAKAAKDTVSA